MMGTIAAEQRPIVVPNAIKPFATIRIDKRKCLLLVYSLFVLFVLFEPAYIRNEAPYHIFFKIAKYAAAVIVIFTFIVRKVKLNALLIGITIFEGLLLLSTIVNGSAIEVWFSDCAYIIVLIFFAQTVMEADAQILSLALSVVLGLYTHINTICRVLYPNGMYTDSLGYKNCWLFGYDNGSCMVILLAITVALFRICNYKGYFMGWDWSVIASGCWFVLIQEIATGIVAGIVFFAFVIASRNAWFREYCSKAVLVITGIFLLFFLMQFITTQISETFSFVFKALGRDGTFTGRIGIWSTAWREIQKDGWLLGRGQQTVETYQRHFGNRVWVVHLHSYYLQVIYEGGFLAFGALLGAFICVAVRFDKGKYSYVYMPFLAGLLSIMLMWQTEAYGDLVKYGFIILSLMYNAPLLQQSKKPANALRIRFILHKSMKHSVQY